MVRVYGAPELPRALPAAARMIRSKLALAGALGAASATVLPVCAVATAVSKASLAFIAIALGPWLSCGGCGRLGRVPGGGCGHASPRGLRPAGGHRQRGGD